jgi:ribonuclease R
VPLPDESQLLDDVAHARGEAKSLNSLYALYGLKGAQRVSLRRMVLRLVQQGALVKLRGGSRYGIPSSSQLVEGVLQGNARGFAFVSPQDAQQPDVFIREADLKGAMHGDRVEVALRPDADPERPAGVVVAILERGDDRVVGLVRRDDSARRVTWRLLPFDPRLSIPIEIPERFLGDADDATWVEARLLRHGREPGRERADGEAIPARVVAVLGTDEEPGTDVRVVLRAHGLQDAHSPEAVAEAERRATTTMTAKEIARREDFRELPTVTIDGETARDFDDAISIERRGQGWRLWVHIADVSAHVLEGSRLDAEASRRATSVYFPERAIHMLPEALAAGACSLVPGQDRLTLTAILDYDATGAVTASSFCESVIRSDRRMTYTEIKRILVDRDAVLRAKHEDLLPRFELMGELAGKLMTRREQRGGLDFDLPEPIIKVDESGLVVDIKPSQRNVAHRIIEEFMIAANEAVALWLTEEGEPGIFRNHEPPPPDKLEAFRQAAAVFGHELKGGEHAEARDLQRVLAAADGRPEEAFLTTLALRTMSVARYEAENRGHFGLALTHYCHFTSPIRRYPDLVVHRALRRRLQGARLDPDDAAGIRADLEEVAAHCSEAERNAEAAERAIVAWKKAAFLRDRLGEEMDARITGIAERGLFVLLSEHHVDGFVPFPSLKHDWYDRDARGFALVGRDTRRTLRLGDPLRVVVEEVDMLRRRVTLSEAPE